MFKEDQNNDILLGKVLLFGLFLVALSVFNSIDNYNSVQNNNSTIIEYFAEMDHSAILPLPLNNPDDNYSLCTLDLQHNITISSQENNRITNLNNLTSLFLKRCEVIFNQNKYHLINSLILARLFSGIDKADGLIS